MSGSTLALAAEALAGTRFRLHGRGGTEGAIYAHAAGERFVLLDGTPIAFDPAKLGSAPAATISALGLGDNAPVTSAIVGRGITQRPLCPVHPRRKSSGGGLVLSWVRRARGASLWSDGVDAPLNEQTETYEIGFGPPDASLARWITSEPRLELGPTTIAELVATLPGGALQVRQVGSHALSAPLLLATLA